MACYNRDFLVPYLRSICALHLTERRLREHLWKLEDKEKSLIRGQSYEKPKYPEQESVGCGTIMLLAFGAMLLFCGIGLRFDLSSIDGSDRMMILIFLFLGGLMLWGGIASVRESKNNHEYDVQIYKRKLAQYEQVQRNNTDLRKKLPNVRSEIGKCEQEIVRVQQLLDQLYRANIVPAQYRGIYPSVYLYDWFSTSQANDLDHALTMYVLEEIRTKLDTIIENQSTMIINQEIMMSNQRKSLEEQRAHNNMMRIKLNSIQATQDEQLRYTKMIEAEAATCAYFATADYIRRI